MDSDGSAKLTTCVRTPGKTTDSVLPDLQVYFLSDTTGSMGGVISNVASSASMLLNAISGLATSVEYAAGEYRDLGDSFVYALNTGFTTDKPTVQAAFDSWDANEGGDLEEANLFALTRVAADEPGKVWNASKSHVLIWFGDAPGHDPSVEGVTLGDAITALESENIIVIALDAGTLDVTGQATNITTTTGGLYVPSLDTSKIVDTIVNAIKKTVRPMITIVPEVKCDPGLSVTFTPAEMSGSAGDTLCFEETLKMTKCVDGGKCMVSFKDKESSKVIGTPQKISVTCCSTELRSVRLWTSGKGSSPRVIKEGSEICIPGGKVSYEAYYGDCMDYRKNPIKKVYLQHSVNGIRKSDNTEDKPRYHLYGNGAGKVIYREPILGKNKITAKANDRTTKEINFTLKKCRR